MFIKYSVVFFLVALCGGYLAVLKAEDRKCEQNWAYYNESCYLYDHKLTSWRNSRQACESKNASLVTVNDQYEMNFIMTILKNKGSWNGLNNINDRNVLEWISGEKSDYRYWYTDEPEIVNNKRCVHMYQKKEHKWHMTRCGFKQRHMCEKAWKPCDSKPCHNGGTCVPNGNDYTCQCMAEFTGLQCEQGITATSTAVNVVIATSRPMEALSTTEAAMPTPGILEVAQSSTVLPAQPDSVVISPSTSTKPATSSSLEGPKSVPRKLEMTTAYTQPEMTTAHTQLEMTTAYAQPEMTKAYIQPEMTTAHTQLEMTTAYAQPEMTKAYIQPEMTTAYTQPEMTTAYAQPEMTTAYTQPKMMTLPPKTDPKSNPGEDGQTGARQGSQSDGINVAAIVVPVVLILLLILLVIIGYICYERNKKQKEKEDETVGMCSGDLALLQPQNGVKSSLNEVPPLYQSKGSLQKSMDSMDDYGEGGSFTEEYGDGKNATPDAKDKLFVAFV